MDQQIDLKKIEKISRALSDPYRIQIMEAIQSREDWVQCTAIIALFNLAQSTVSRHIKRLANANLVIQEREGRHAKYKVNRDVMGEYVSFLSLFEA